MIDSGPPSPLRCLVADDDPVACDVIEAHLKQAGASDFCLKANDGLTALHLLAASTFDLVFLDMNMPGIDGISLLRALPRGLPIIIVSGSTDFAAQSYEYDVVDYLVKPLDFPRFCQALGKARQRLSLRTTHQSPADPHEVEEIFVKDGTRVQKIDLSELLVIKAEANYVDFISQEKSVMSLISLKRLEELLPKQFVRVHRSYIVNRNRISRVEEGTVIIGKHKVPIGDFYREEFMRRLGVIQ